MRENREGKLFHLAGTPSRGLPRARIILPVFYGLYTLNCLFCQNWQYRVLTRNLYPTMSAGDLAARVDGQTFCICFFGEDPAPQVPHALRSARKALVRKPDIKICWETAGNISEALFPSVMEVSYESGGTVKFDLKAYNENLYFALTGGTSRSMWNNFSRCAAFSREKKVTLSAASKLLIPGYISEQEVFDIARVICFFDPWTPYSLMGFYPHFRMDDLPATSRDQAEARLIAAREVGLRNVHLANEHLME